VSNSKGSDKYITNSIRLFGIHWKPWLRNCSFHSVENRNSSPDSG